jgi:pilus assembly protein TadC
MLCDMNRDTLKQQAITEIKEHIQPALAELADYIQQVIPIYLLYLFLSSILIFVFVNPTVAELIPFHLHMNCVKVLGSSSGFSLHPMCQLCA